MHHDRCWLWMRLGCGLARSTHDCALATKPSSLEGFVVSYKTNASFSGKRAMLVFFSEPRYSHSPCSRALVIGE